MTTVGSRIANVVRERLGSPFFARSPAPSAGSDGGCMSVTAEVERDVNTGGSRVQCDDGKCSSGAALQSVFGALTPWSPWQWYASWKWCPTSEWHLAVAEQRVMSKVKTPFVGKRVDFTSPHDNEEHHLWALCFEKSKEEETFTSAEVIGKKKPAPLVLVHGFGNGAAFWCANFDRLALDRDVYAVDLPGFARSCRPKFCKDPKKTEAYFVHCLEEFRRQLGIEKMILLGHSMGGFFVSRYACAHSSRVAHLILVDPWGLPKHPEGVNWSNPMPFWIKSAYMTRINPLRVMRALGPIGPFVSKIASHYAWNRYSWFLQEEAPAMADYLFHANVLGRSGEDAFEALTLDLFWAKHPVLDDLIEVDSKLGISFIYGAASWLDSTPGEQCKAKRPDSFVSIIVIDKAGHDIFADVPKEFDKVVTEICDQYDRGCLR